MTETPAAEIQRLVAELHEVFAGDPISAWDSHGYKHTALYGAAFDTADAIIERLRVLTEEGKHEA